MSSKKIQGSSFTDDDVEIISRNVVYQGFFKMEEMQLRHRLFNGGWTPIFSREIFVRGQAVAAVMYDPKNQLIGLIEQFRVGALVDHRVNKRKMLANSPWLCEIVAGMTETGESPKDVILRELVEEAGMRPDKLLPICEYFTSPGGTDETLVLFCAIGDLTQVGGVHGLADEHEDIRVLVLPEQEVFEHLYSGRFSNAATLICLQWLLINGENVND